jgi:hypothetical protein
MEINIMIKKRKNNKDGLFPIKLRYSQKDKRKYVCLKNFLGEKWNFVSKEDFSIYNATKVVISFMHQKQLVISVLPCLLNLRPVLFR